MAFKQRLNGFQQPSNSGSVSIARSTLDQIIPMAQRRYNNALSVNGFPVLYYQHKTHGIRCTCCSDKPINADSGETLNSKNFSSKEYVNSLLSASTVRINRYGSRETLAEEVTPQTELNLNDSNSKEFSNLFKSLSTTNKSTDLSLGSDEVEGFDSNDLFGDNSDILSNTLSESTGCGVCLGSGWVGGYNLLNGARFVFDTQYTGWVPTDLMQVTHLKPNVFKPLKPSIEINLLLPRCVSNIDALRLFSNRKQITDVSFQVYDETTATWVSLENIRNLLPHCDGVVHKLRVTFGNSLAKDLKNVNFTHLEFQVDIGSDPLYVEWNRLIETQNLSLPENFEPIQVIVSPMVPTVRMFDVVSEPYYGRVWKVTTSLDFYDREKNSNGWEAQIRLLQKYELQSILPVRTLKHIDNNRVKTTSLPRFNSPLHSGNTYNPVAPDKSSKTR